MLSLRELQQRMSGAVLSPQRLAGGGEEIYRYAYGARLAGALASNYPVLARRMGSDFLPLARKYASRRPSAHYNIRWYGAHLWRLLHGANADLARMEWALGLAFDAKDAPSLSQSRLRALPVDEWPNLPVALHPSTLILCMSWTAEKLWQGTAEAWRERHALFVWRKDLHSQWRIAGKEEAKALRALQRLGTLQRACEVLPEEDLPRIGEWFAGWVQEGMLTLREPA